jgi:hypothetical protein
MILKYYLDVKSQALYWDSNGERPFTLPQHYLGDKIQHEIHLMELIENPGTSGVSYTPIDTTGVDLQLEIGLSGASASILASIESVADGGFTRVTGLQGYFLGELDLNTVQLGQDDRTNLKFELKISDPDWRCCYQQKNFLLLGVVRNVTGVTLPTTVASLQNAFDQRYVKWNNNDAGATLTFTSKSGLRQTTIFASDSGGLGELDS